MDGVNFQPVFDYIDQTKKDILEYVATKVASKEELKQVQKTLDALVKSHKETQDSVTILQSKSENVES
jgi:cell division septum initiation protein DivIVA